MVKVRPVIQVVKDLLAQKDHEAFRVWQERRVKQEYRVSRVKLGIQDSRVILEYRVFKVKLGIQDSKVKLVYRAYRVNRVLREILVLKERRVRKVLQGNRVILV
jgi:hypothetical protein